MHALAKHLQAQGRGNDSMLVHMTPREVGGLQALARASGGSLTTNPNTGFPEAGWLDSILPTLAGVAGGALGVDPWIAGLGGAAVQTAVTGDLGKGLMAGLGAFGGASIGYGMLGGSGRDTLGLNSAIGKDGKPITLADTSKAGASSSTTWAPDATGTMHPVTQDAALGATSTPANKGMFENFSAASKAGMGDSFAKYAPFAAALGVASPLLDSMGPKTTPYNPTPSTTDPVYKGPYTFAPRQVISKPNQLTNSSEHMYFQNPNDYQVIPHAAAGGLVALADGGVTTTAAPELYGDPSRGKLYGGGKPRTGADYLAMLGALPGGTPNSPYKDYTFHPQASGAGEKNYGFVTPKGVDLSGTAIGGGASTPITDTATFDPFGTAVGPAVGGMSDIFGGVGGSSISYGRTAAPAPTSNYDPITAEYGLPNSTPNYDTYGDFPVPGGGSYDPITAEYGLPNPPSGNPNDPITAEYGLPSGYNTSYDQNNKYTGQPLKQGEFIAPAGLSLQDYYNLLHQYDTPTSGTGSSSSGLGALGGNIGKYLSGATNPLYMPTAGQAINGILPYIPGIGQLLSLGSGALQGAGVIDRPDAAPANGNMLERNLLGNGVFANIGQYLGSGFDSSKVDPGIIKDIASAIAGKSGGASNAIAEGAYGYTPGKDASLDKVAAQMEAMHGGKGFSFDNTFMGYTGEPLQNLGGADLYTGMGANPYFGNPFNNDNGGQGIGPTGYTPSPVQVQSNYNGPSDEDLRQQIAHNTLGNIDLNARGGSIRYAEGGPVHLGNNSFVVDARTVSEMGNGSSSAGQELLARLGGQPIHGPGDGVSDSIHASIGGKQEARVARDEVQFSPEAVARLGGGDASKGSKFLYSLMAKAREARIKAAKKDGGRGVDTGLRALVGAK